MAPIDSKYVDFHTASCLVNVIYDSVNSEHLSSLSLRNFDTAAALIEDEIGSGIERSFLMSTAFKGAKEETSILLERLADLNPEDGEFAIAGLYDRVGYLGLPDSDLLALLSSPWALLKREQLGVAISVDLLNSTDPAVAQAKFARIHELLGQVPENSRFGLATAMLSGASSSLPFSAWEIAGGIDQKGASSDKELAEFKRILKSISEEMLSEDPETALSEFRDSDKFGLDFLESGIARWLRLNEKEATEWLAENHSSLSPAQLGVLQVGEASVLTDSGNFNAARERIQGVTDLELKRRAEGQIWSAERNTLRKEVAKDPGGTVLSIVSGQSKYGDYWIEEAMSTWVAKDFDKAQDWYQKNWNSMPANKSQYLAAAFAKQAASQGDVATAREWAAHIQDAKTKQRIEAGIAKAVEPQGN